VFVSAALAKDGALLGERFLHSTQGHSALLLPMIDELLHDCGYMIGDVDRFAVTNGPGSFTGVRIGAATVKGLAHPDRHCAGVSTLAAMAACAPSPGSPQSPQAMWGESWPGILCCAMDARRAQVYAALFDAGGRLTEDEALPISELEQRLMAYDQPVTFLGDGAALCHGIMQTRPGWALAPEEWRYQRGWGAVLAAGEADYRPAAELRVQYLRPSQAERLRRGSPPSAQ